MAQSGFWLGFWEELRLTLALSFEWKGAHSASYMIGISIHEVNYFANSQRVEASGNSR
jgi:hypothetical protein